MSIVASVGKGRGVEGVFFIQRRRFSIEYIDACSFRKQLIGQTNTDVSAYHFLFNHVVYPCLTVSRTTNDALHIICRPQYLFISTYWTSQSNITVKITSSKKKKIKMIVSPASQTDWQWGRMLIAKLMIPGSLKEENLYFLNGQGSSWFVDIYFSSLEWNACYDVNAGVFLKVKFEIFARLVASVMDSCEVRFRHFSGSKHVFSDDRPCFDLFLFPSFEKLDISGT